jgi:spermidine/putrescine-binding protein
LTDGDGGPCGTLSDAAVKAHNAAVAEWLKDTETRDPKRVARVYAKFAHLSDRQIAWRQSKESYLSPLMEQSLDIAVDINGKRIHPPSDV